MIYLDNAATTYPKPESVYSALDNANRCMAFNAGRGSYQAAKNVARMIDDTREKVASLVSARPETVSFESSATEAMNIIINGLDLKDGDNIYISPFEHNAIVRPLFNLQKTINLNIYTLPFFEKSWEFDGSKASDMFVMNKPKACFITHISNVTGYILPYGTIFALTKKYNCINILDCAQSLGVINPSTKDVDFMVFAGHKSLYASFGIAGFLNLTNTILKVSKSGGTGSDSLNTEMPESGNGRYESGSANSVAIAGLNQSIDWLREKDIYSHEKELTTYLVSKLKELTKVVIFAPDKIDLFGIVSFAVKGYAAADIGDILSEDFDICVRTGYHCAPFIHDFIGSKQYGGTVRVSLSYFSSKTDIDVLVDALQSL